MKFNIFQFVTAVGILFAGAPALADTPKCHPSAGHHACSNKATTPDGHAKKKATDKMKAHELEEELKKLPPEVRKKLLFELTDFYKQLTGGQDIVPELRVILTEKDRYQLVQMYQNMMEDPNASHLQALGNYYASFVTKPEEKQHILDTFKSPEAYEKATGVNLGELNHVYKTILLKNQKETSALVLPDEDFKHGGRSGELLEYHLAIIKKDDHDLQTYFQQHLETGSASDLSGKMNMATAGAIMNYMHLMTLSSFINQTTSGTTLDVSGAILTGTLPGRDSIEFRYQYGQEKLQKDLTNLVAQTQQAGADLDKVFQSEVQKRASYIAQSDPDAAKQFEAQYSAQNDRAEVDFGKYIHAEKYLGLRVVGTDNSTAQIGGELIHKYLAENAQARALMDAITKGANADEALMKSFNSFGCETATCRQQVLQYIKQRLPEEYANVHLLTTVMPGIYHHHHKRSFGWDVASFANNAVHVAANAVTFGLEGSIETLATGKANPATFMGSTSDAAGVFGTMAGMGLSGLLDPISFVAGDVASEGESAGVAAAASGKLPEGGVSTAQVVVSDEGHMEMATINTNGSGQSLESPPIGETNFDTQVSSSGDPEKSAPSLHKPRAQVSFNEEVQVARIEEAEAGEGTEAGAQVVQPQESVRLSEEVSESDSDVTSRLKLKLQTMDKNIEQLSSTINDVRNSDAGESEVKEILDQLHRELKFKAALREDLYKRISNLMENNNDPEHVTFEESFAWDESSRPSVPKYYVPTSIQRLIDADLAALEENVSVLGMDTESGVKDNYVRNLNLVKNGERNSKFNYGVESRINYYINQLMQGNIESNTFAVGMDGLQDYVDNAVARTPDTLRFKLQESFRQGNLVGDMLSDPELPNEFRSYLKEHPFSFSSESPISQLSHAIDDFSEMGPLSPEMREFVKKFRGKVSEMEQDLMHSNYIEKIHSQLHEAHDKFSIGSPVQQSSISKDDLVVVQKELNETIKELKAEINNYSQRKWWQKLFSRQSQLDNMQARLKELEEYKSEFTANKGVVEMVLDNVDSLRDINDNLSSLRVHKAVREDISRQIEVLSVDSVKNSREIEKLKYLRDGSLDHGYVYAEERIKMGLNQLARGVITPQEFTDMMSSVGDSLREQYKELNLDNLDYVMQKGLYGDYAKLSQSLDFLRDINVDTLPPEFLGYIRDNQLALESGKGLLGDLTQALIDYRDAMPWSPEMQDFVDRLNESAFSMRNRYKGHLSQMADTLQKNATRLGQLSTKTPKGIDFAYFDDLGFNNPARYYEVQEYVDLTDFDQALASIDVTDIYGDDYREIDPEKLRMRMKELRDVTDKHYGYLDQKMIDAEFGFRNLGNAGENINIFGGAYELWSELRDIRGDLKDNIDTLLALHEPKINMYDDVLKQLEQLNRSDEIIEEILVPHRIQQSISVPHDTIQDLRSEKVQIQRRVGSTRSKN